jgi:DNA-binding transcriptional ArsR family regulator
MKIKDLSSEQLERAANMLKAIAHPMRIAILNYLDDGKFIIPATRQIHLLLPEAR